MKVIAFLKREQPSQAFVTLEKMTAVLGCNDGDVLMSSEVFQTVMRLLEHAQEIPPEQYSWQVKPLLEKLKAVR